MRLCHSTGALPLTQAIVLRRRRLTTESVARWIVTFTIVVLASFLSESVTRADGGFANEIASPLWTAEQVGQWAADRSPAAQMLETERAAAGAGIDRDDPKQCAQASLKQHVMADLAKHERNRSASDALEVYYRIVGLTRQRQLLVEAEAVIDRLITMADEAESLGMSNEDPNDLRRKRLVTDDQLMQVDSGINKLRLQLGQLTGQPIERSAEAILLSPLRVGDSIPSTQESITVAMEQRYDLRALNTLSQRLNTSTLPAVRDLLAAQRPGLGMVTQIARRVVLPCLSGPDTSGQDLRLRKQQCRQLSQARADQIELEVRGSLVDLSTAQHRAELADRRVQLASTSVEKRRASIKLDQAVPGSDSLVRLEMLTAQGDHVQRQVDEAVGWIHLRESQGVVLGGN